jgi:sporulation protein YlmC with PRC-barrel domain
MKQNLFLATLTLGIASTLLVPGAQAADDLKSSTSTSSTLSTDQGAPGKGSFSTSGQSQKCVRLSQLTGGSLKNTSGETLGQINDFVVDPTTGRIEFAVLSLSGGANSGKLTAIPFTLIRPSGEGQNLTANIDKDKLASAQTFDRSQWPDMSQESWGQTIYSHYGLQWQDRSSAGGRVPLGGSETGTGVNATRPNSGTDADNSTAPDGKGTLRQNGQPQPGAQPDSTTSPTQAKDKDSSSTSPQGKDKDALK